VPVVNYREPTEAATFEDVKFNVEPDPGDPVFPFGPTDEKGGIGINYEPI